MSLKHSSYLCSVYVMKRKKKYLVGVNLLKPISVKTGQSPWVDLGQDVNG